MLEREYEKKVNTLRISSFGCVALRDSPSVTYQNTLIGLTLGRLPDNLKCFEYNCKTPTFVIPAEAGIQPAFKAKENFHI